LLGDVQQIDSLLTARQGQWTLVNFWATWCRPCVAEIPALVALEHDLKSTSLAMVGVSLDFVVVPAESTAVRKVAEFGARYRVSYPNLIYTGSTDALTERFNLTGVIPVTLLFDPRGNEVERWVGVMTAADFERVRVRAK
jgi:thiol-disulfide isomerase/thioredoxin